jgi:hypothetical protein
LVLWLLAEVGWKGFFKKICFDFCVLDEVVALLDFELDLCAGKADRGLGLAWRFVIDALSVLQVLVAQVMRRVHQAGFVLREGTLRFCERFDSDTNVLGLRFCYFGRSSKQFWLFHLCSFDVAAGGLQVAHEGL